MATAKKSASKKANKTESTNSDVKTERFKKVAGRRTSQVIKVLGNLGNTGNRNVYGYTDEQVSKMFSAIDNAVAEAKDKFIPKAKQEIVKKTFSFE